ncbi:tRNA (uracil-5-)-methyltransferase-like protein A [Hypsibius exemplaris]|uniref:tRNA (uracil(54)-C(5))-methyltransferase n=1 Tax=Hypsibius exemplaris TaxID=2072580 RepID=A0A1W0XDB2_HYPEX|nr:tRNA (uracil-5-)-methyltransferase-like protein A [Hypsibius exemplaris]
MNGGVMSESQPEDQANGGNGFSSVLSEEIIGDPCKAEDSIESKVELTDDGDLVSDAADSETPCSSSDPRDHQTGPIEYHRLVLQNLPKYFGFKQLKNWIEKLGIRPTNIKPVQGKGRHGAVQCCYLSFRSKQASEDAIPIIATTPFRGHSLLVKSAEAAPDPYTRQDRNPRGRSDKNERMETSSTIPPELQILPIVTNLHHLSYDDQLKAKQNHAVEILRKIDKKFQYSSQGTIQWLKGTRGQFCAVDKIKPSPMPEKYRNKCEFSVGFSPSGERTVGFKMGKYKDGIIHVVSPSECKHINDAMQEIVKIFQVFIRSSGFEPLNERSREGHWHQLTARTNAAGDSMVNVHFHPQKLSPEEINGEKERLQKYYEGLDDAHRPTFLYWVVDDRHTFGRRTERMGEELIIGNKETVFEEALLGYKFMVSPDAFFQVNTSAAEVLYSTIVEAASVSPNTVVLDLCCGTGTIGIVLAKHVKQVYGVELGEAAVADATRNASINGVTNIEFICSKVEDVLSDLLKTKVQPSDEVVVILDPPRCGVHNSVVELLRRSDSIHRLLYVACAADNEYTISNLYGLCKSRAKDGRAGEVPFVPVRCTPVDLFPLTKNVELLFVFERAAADASDPDVGMPMQ